MAVQTNPKVHRLKSILQANTVPIIIPGSPKGKTISSFCYPKAVAGGKAIYNRRHNDAIAGQKKICIAVDLSGSRSSSQSYASLLYEGINLYYQIKSIVGVQNVKIYGFNRDIANYEEIVSKSILIKKSWREAANEGDEYLIRNADLIEEWCDRVCPGGYSMDSGNHDGYSLQFIAELPFWGEIRIPDRIIVHISDGQPSCGRHQCKMPGCHPGNEIVTHYEQVVKELLRNKWIIAGIGIGRDLSPWYGNLNCAQVDGRSDSVLDGVIQVVSRHIKANRYL